MVDYDRFIAGFAGGLSLQLFHPLDLIRTRLQSIDSSRYINTPIYLRYKDTVKSILQNEGKFALFKGMWFSLVANVVIGSFFTLNESLKKKLNQHDFFKRNPGVEAFTSAFGIAFLFSVLGTPLYVIKTWKLLDNKEINVTPSTFKIMKDIKAAHGYLGFYRGFSVAFLMGINGTITVALNDYCKFLFPDFYSTSLGNFLLSGSVRLFSSTIFYPLSTVRTKMMRNQMFKELSDLKYNNMQDCMSKTYKREGIRGFFNGYLANAFRVFLSSALLFTIYEKTYSYLKIRKNNH